MHIKTACIRIMPGLIMSIKVTIRKIKTSRAPGIKSIIATIIMSVNYNYY